MVRRAAIGSTLALSFCAILPGHAFGWQVRIGDTKFGVATMLARDGNADVVAAGWEYRSPPLTGRHWLVAKFNGARGTEAWRWAGDGTIHRDSRFGDMPFGIAIDAEGSAVLVGSMDNERTDEDAMVVKLSAAGEERWRQAFSGGTQGSDAATQVLVASDGDFFVAGTLDQSLLGEQPDPKPTTTVVMRLAGESGAVIWRADGTPPSRTVQLLEGPDGTLLLIARDIAGPAVGESYFLVALDSVTGIESWRRPIDGMTWVYKVALDRAGNVFLVGEVDGWVPAVVKMSSTTGNTLWRHFEPDVPWVPDLAVDLYGNVLAAGAGVATKLHATRGVPIWTVRDDRMIMNGVAVTSSNDMVLCGARKRPQAWALSGRSGHQQWRRWIHRTRRDTGQLYQCLVDDEGRLFAAGVSRKQFAVLGARIPDRRPGD